jgi:hypothetical protein
VSARFSAFRSRQLRNQQVLGSSPSAGSIASRTPLDARAFEQVRLRAWVALSLAFRGANVRGAEQGQGLHDRGVDPSGRLARDPRAGALADDIPELDQ